MSPYTDYEVMIASICHEANRKFCQTQGDDSQMPWDEAPAWQRDSACMGVQKILSGQVTEAQQSHMSWLEQKLAEGWKYGPVKDAEKKEHPCMVPFQELPAWQQQKDYLFFAIVKSFGRR